MKCPALEKGNGRGGRGGRVQRGQRRGGILAVSAGQRGPTDTGLGGVGRPTGLLVLQECITVKCLERERERDRPLVTVRLCHSVSQ